MSDRRLLLALDFGGTKHTVAVLVSGKRKWWAHKRVFCPQGADADYDLKTVCSLARNLLAGEQPAAVGVSFGGPVDAGAGVVHLSHHVPGWEGKPLAEILEAEFGAPASIDNDGNVAALGEYRFGAGRGFDSLLYITVSTGVGGGWILDGQLWRGADGMAGEIGHVVIDPNGPVCVCGGRGCLERLASGPYIAQRARQWLEAQPDRGRILRAMTKDATLADKLTGRENRPIGESLETIDAELVSQAAALGDDLAWEALEVAAWALGMGIGNAANLVNPQRFVLGGGVTKAGDRFWEVIRRVARETAMPNVNFDVVPAILGDDAPVWGAVALAEDCLA